MDTLLFFLGLCWSGPLLMGTPVFVTLLRLATLCHSDIGARTDAAAATATYAATIIGAYTCTHPIPFHTRHLA